jgi:nitrile hydratase subunit beta
MNGIHDMGGMQGFGPVQPEADEPVFHSRWEGRVYALRRLMNAWRRWNIDAGRYSIECLPPTEYLRTSYYEKWLASLVSLMVKKGLVTLREVKMGHAESGTPKQTPPISAEGVLAMLAAGGPTARPAPAPARFSASQPVRAKTVNPTGHTRLPRYVRGRLGMIERDHGAHVFPDSNAHFLGEQPQRLYTVRFAARELWGPTAKPADAVYLDLWEEYLDPA